MRYAPEVRLFCYICPLVGANEMKNRITKLASLNVEHFISSNVFEFVGSFGMWFILFCFVCFWFSWKIPISLLKFKNVPKNKLSKSKAFRHKSLYTHLFLVNV